VDERFRTVRRVMVMVMVKPDAQAGRPLGFLSGYSCSQSRPPRSGSKRGISLNHSRLSLSLPWCTGQAGSAVPRPYRSGWSPIRSALIIPAP